MSASLRTDAATLGTSDSLVHSKALQAIAALDTPPLPGFDALAQLAAHACAAQIAIVSLLDGERVWFTSVHGIDPGSLAGERSTLCCEIARAQQGLEVADAQLDPRLAGKPLLGGAPAMGYGAGAPIKLHGRVIGTVCVFDPAPHRGSAASLRALESVAVIATAMLTARIEAFQLFCSTR